MVRLWMWMAHVRLWAARRLPGQSGAGELATVLAVGAFSVAAIAVIWTAMQAAGVDIVNWIRETILGSGGPAGDPPAVPSP